MLLFDQRIHSFCQLGEEINSLIHNFNERKSATVFSEVVRKAMAHNPWFTEQNIYLMLNSIAKMLDRNKLERLTQSYPELKHGTAAKTIAVIMAGNIPLVGFQDFLHVLLTGHRFLGKLSHQDRFLLPAIAALLIKIEPAFESEIQFTDQTINNFDAVIATGSDNSGRYFDYYFGNYPHIIRRNRHGVAILTGNESTASLSDLGLDVFSFFGLGCRNVSTIFVPEGYKFDKMFEAFEPFEETANHSKYFSNYEYNKAIFLVNGVQHYDNGFVLIQQADSFGSPVAVIHYQTYTNTQELEEILKLNQEKIQCVVSDNAWFKESYPLGQAQFPAINDFADGIDTIDFLIKLNEVKL